MTPSARDLRHLVRAVDALTTQVRRLADTRQTPADDTRHAAIAAALTAEHYRRAEARTVASPEEHCAAMATAVMRVLTPTVDTDDAPTTTGSDGVCEHDGAHPGFTCGEVDQTRLFWEAQWARDAEARRTAPPADEAQRIADEQRTARRHSLHNLLDRLDRSTVHTWAESHLLRQHIEEEIRDADTARAVARSNLQHVKTIVPEVDRLAAELEQAQAALDRVRQLHTRTTVQTTGGPADACSSCESDSMSYPWPCPTAEALVGPRPGGSEQPTTTETPADSCKAHNGHPCFPEPGARCSAHGTHQCALCHRNPGSCAGDLGGCTTWSLEGMHWDTCPNRIK
ncbi:hypothetical protein ACF1AE_25545 [Streptomyces sp. NPDC014986]|uniref:hypothetical protein n=1 Tax=Streptomyces sp. NPDC014986 TaxID=3364934 RepID=UPI0036F8A997